MAREEGPPLVQEPVVLRGREVDSLGLPALVWASSRGLLWVALSGRSHLDRLTMGMRLVVEFRRPPQLVHLDVVLERVSSATSPGGPVVLVGLRPEGPGRTVQRRAFFRVAAALPVTYVPVDIPSRFETDRDLRDSTLLGWRLEPRSTYFLARTRDISASGLGLHVQHRLELRQGLFLEVRVGEETIRAAGRVVRMAMGGGGALAGVEFLSLEESEQDHIIRFAFARQQGGRR